MNACVRACVCVRVCACVRVRVCVCEFYCTCYADGTLMVFQRKLLISFLQDNKVLSSLTISKTQYFNQSIRRHCLKSRRAISDQSCNRRCLNSRSMSAESHHHHRLQSLGCIYRHRHNISCLPASEPVWPSGKALG